MIIEIAALKLVFHLAIYPFAVHGWNKALTVRDAGGLIMISGLPAFYQIRLSDKRPAHGYIILNIITHL